MNTNNCKTAPKFEKHLNIYNLKLKGYLRIVHCATFVLSFLIMLIPKDSIGQETLTGGIWDTEEDLIVINDNGSVHDAGIKLISLKSGESRRNIWTIFNDQENGNLGFSSYGTSSGFSSTTAGYRRLTFTPLGDIIFNTRHTGGSTSKLLFNERNNGTNDYTGIYSDQPGHMTLASDGEIKFKETDTDFILVNFKLNPDQKRVDINGFLDIANGLTVRNNATIDRLNSDRIFTDYVYAKEMVVDDLDLSESVIEIYDLTVGTIESERTAYLGGNVYIGDRTDPLLKIDHATQTITFNGTVKFPDDDEDILHIGDDPVPPSLTDYRMYVEEGVATESVKVTNTTSWSDFVFYEDYNLKPLEQVANFIEKNKHLPDVPSQKDIEDKGYYDQHEINKVLLQKIEELTLYVIDQQAQIKAQQSELENLKAKN